ncbi:MAG: TIGR02444 family protein [Parvibaculum sp.]|nr:TIGR02444 family protein [Parvibaculum sp.]
MSSEAQTAAANAFWGFSTALYAKPGVETELLALQDGDGLEVNLALFCLYAAMRGQALDYAAVEAMRGVGLAWGHGVVAPLRQARRLLKPSASGSDEAARLRNEVKAIELAAEKAMQGVLAELLVTAASPDTHAQRLLAAQNFAAWFDEEGIDDEGPRAGVTYLINAAFPL